MLKLPIQHCEKSMQALKPNTKLQLAKTKGKLVRKLKLTAEGAPAVATYIWEG